MNASTPKPPEIMQTWELQRSTGSAHDFHHRTVSNPNIAQLWVHNLNAPALVLGSTQDPGLIDHNQTDAAGIETCKRRSGGGIVRIEPEDLWIDLILPRQSSLWRNDIGESVQWLGLSWAKALHQFLEGEPKISVHSGPPINKDLGKIICFAGLGSGEVTVDESKVVGISQRRTRDFARFQCLIKNKWDVDSIRPFLQVSPPEQSQSISTIPWEELAIGIPPRYAPRPFNRETLLQAFISSLPKAT